MLATCAHKPNGGNTAKKVAAIKKHAQRKKRKRRQTFTNRPKPTPANPTSQVQERSLGAIRPSNGLLLPRDVGSRDDLARDVSFPPHSHINSGGELSVLSHMSRIPALAPVNSEALHRERRAAVRVRWVRWRCANSAGSEFPFT